jgi:glycosyltransferase involved in cell wall biosynthesis
MRLLFLDSIDKATFGGYENWVLLTARHLCARGHHVTVAGREGSEYLRRAVSFCPEAAQLELRIGGDFDPRTIARIRSFLSREKIDLITVNFNKDVRLGGLAARWDGGVKVCWRLGLDITSKGWVHRYLSPKLVDGVIVPSEALKRQAMRHGYITDEMVRVIYNGTEDKRVQRPDPDAARALREKYGLAENAVIAVTVGRFVDQKGHEYLVRAAPAIIKGHPEVVFMFLGDGGHRRMLQRMITRQETEKYFVFAGMLDNIEPELAGADLMIHPAIEEPFSHAILEAMRAGLPIVASRVGGIPEAVEEDRTALLVKARDPATLAEAVNRMVADPAMRREFGQNAQQRWHDKFRVDTMIDRTENYFRELIGRSEGK